MALTITANQLISQTLQTIGAIGQDNLTPSAADGSLAFSLLQELIDQWNIRNLTILTRRIDLENLVSGQGGRTNPYTYGPGGNWDTGTEPRPPAIESAYLVLNTNVAQPVRIPLAILTTNMYSAIPIPALPNQLPVELYYNDTVPLGEVFLWPVPSDSTNQIELTVPVVTANFVDRTTSYICAPGYLKAFRLALAEACLLPFAVPLTTGIATKVIQDAADAMRVIEQNNLEMSDVSLDPAFTPQPRGTYVIQTDQGA